MRAVALPCTTLPFYSEPPIPMRLAVGKSGPIRVRANMAYFGIASARMRFPSSPPIRSPQHALNRHPLLHDMRVIFIRILAGFRACAYGDGGPACLGLLCA